LRRFSGEVSRQVSRLIGRFDPALPGHCEAISGILRIEMLAQDMVDQFCRERGR
jgi:hypothetical protein